MRKLWTEITKTPGPIKVQLSLLTILAISSVSSTSLLILNRVGSTSAGRTSNSIESLEVADANGRVRVTGKHTTEVLKNLTRTGNFWGIVPSQEKSSDSIKLKEK